MRVSWLAIVVYLAGCACTPMPGSELPSQAVIKRVFETFNQCNVEALIENFSDENLVFFTATTPSALTDRAALRKYFSFLDAEPCASPKSVKHTDVTLQVQALGVAAAVVHARTTIRFEDEGKAIGAPHYFTFVVQEISGRWLVVSLTALPVRRQ